MKAILLLIFICLSSHSLANEIRLAVASNFRPTLEDLVTDYQRQYDGQFAISSASTGVLYAQIKQGAPFDIFFSADKKTIQNLARQLGQEEQPFTYAHGQLAFWCPDGAPQNVDAMKVWRGSFSIANPKLAPYGVAAKEIIEKLNWPASLHPIMGNNIAQVAQFLMTKNVQCGFIAKSLIPVGTPASQLFELPVSWYRAIEQQAVVLPRATKNKIAKSFIQFIKTEALGSIERAGYGLPDVQYD